MKTGKRYNECKALVEKTKLYDVEESRIIRQQLISSNGQGHGMLAGVLKEADADLLIVAGTSLTVYPAAGLINYYRGRHLVLINRDETPYDGRADLVFRQSLGDIFTQL